MSELLQAEGQDLQLFHDECLGSGSYGKVCKAKLNELPCAAKLLHIILFQFEDPRSQTIRQRFEQECEILQNMRHPNVVQYLGMTHDPQSGLPILLMELLDGNLTDFLEHSQEPLPYHLQVNLWHDIALALTYLHSKHIIHRDLSGNNVLLIAGSRAKVSDFGMSKLSVVDASMSRLTQCPGAPLYMSPEALRTPPIYTDKLDVFSSGVVAIQIITRNYPEPGPDMLERDDPSAPTGISFAPIPEIERRRNHIDLIDLKHPMLSLIEGCLKDRERERPSARQLCHQLVTLKQAPEYTQSKQQPTQQERRIQEQEQLIQEQHKKIQDQRREQQQAAQEMQTEFERFERQTQELEQEVEERKRRIYEQQQALYEQQQQACNQQQQMRKQRSSIQQMQTQITKSEKEVQVLNTRLRENSQELQSKKQELWRAQYNLQQKTEELKQKTDEFQHKREELQGKLQQALQDQGLQEFQVRITELESKLKENQDQRRLMEQLPPERFTAEELQHLKKPNEEEWEENLCKLSLDNEIAAKGKIQEQLTNVTAQLSKLETRAQNAESEVEALRKENERMQKQLQHARLGSMGASGRTESFSHFFGSPHPTIPENKPAPALAPVPPITRKASATRESVHELIVRTFDTPTKCDVCTSVMFGLVRQGLVCKNCQMSCHVHCKDKPVATCPLPPGQAKLPFGINIHHGVGTACEGWIKIPKPGGVRRGWQRAYAIVCDFKVFLHEPSNDIHAPAAAATHIFDIRDHNFAVLKVTSQDVIHAGPNLVPAIFKISTNQLRSSEILPSIRNEVLILTENETEKERWVATLEELHKAVKQSTSQLTPVFGCREMYNTQQLDVLKNPLSAAVVSPERILIGDNDGLFMVYLPEDHLFKFSDRDTRKVLQIRIIKEEELIVLIAGRGRVSLRLLPLSALESGDVKTAAMKVADTEEASLFTCGNLGPTWYICVAVKNKVLSYELNRTKVRYEKKKEMAVPYQAHSLQMFNEKLCVGYQSGFCLFHLYMDGKPQKLVHTEDLTLGFIRLNNLLAMHAVEINNGQEYLLCFNVVGVFVNREGRRSRKQELLWHSAPTSFVYKAPYLLAFCDSALEVYEVTTGKWIQTLPFRKLNALSEDGSLALCCDSDPPTLLYLKKQMDEDILRLPELSRSRVGTHSERIRPSKSVRPDIARRSQRLPNKPAISAPSNYTNLQHFGPYQMPRVEDMPDAGLDLKAHVGHPAVSQLAHDPHSTYSLSALDQGKPYADQGLPKSESMEFPAEEEIFPKTLTTDFLDDFKDLMQ